MCKKEPKKTILNYSFVQKKPRKNKLDHNETGHLQGVSEDKTAGMTGNDICIFLTFKTMLVIHRLKIKFWI